MQRACAWRVRVRMHGACARWKMKSGACERTLAAFGLAGAFSVSGALKFGTSYLSEARRVR
eukprot:2961572-Pleurochrysis_carterae.AAC.1